MINKLLKVTMFLASSALLFNSYPTFSAPYFVENFDSGGAPAAFTPNPEWSLAQIFDQLVGPGNLFDTSTASCHSAPNSLRFSYNARNGFCNTCGLYLTQHLASGHNNVDYFITDENLAATDDPATSRANDGPAAAIGKTLYNNDNGFSKWEVTEVVSDGGTNNRLNLKLLHAGINGETPKFNSGDSVSIARMCGLDGNIGLPPNPYRRTDCNGAIVYFNHVDPGDQSPGQSIFRRVYLKAEISSSVLHQKLHYWNTDNEVLDPNNNPITAGQVILLADNNNNRPLEPQLVGLSIPQIGGENYTVIQGNIPPIEFERGVWYYIEEEYKAATENGLPDAFGIQDYNDDGEYRLWMSKSADATLNDDPLIEALNLKLAPLDQDSTGISNSFWGNVQHDETTVGSWYMDDMYITGDLADTTVDSKGRPRIGPVAQSGSCPDIPAPDKQ